MYQSVEGKVMRYYASRKVGKRGRVGVSMSDKEVNGCLSELFVWPFKLFYYIVIWPFKWVFGKLRHSISGTRARSTTYLKFYMEVYELAEH